MEPSEIQIWARNLGYSGYVLDIPCPRLVPRYKYKQFQTSKLVLKRQELLLKKQDLIQKLKEEITFNTNCDSSMITRQHVQHIVTNGIRNELELMSEKLVVEFGTNTLSSTKRNIDILESDCHFNLDKTHSIMESDIEKHPVLQDALEYHVKLILKNNSFAKQIKEKRDSIPDVKNTLEKRMYACIQVLEFIKSFQIQKNYFEEDIMDLELTFSRNHECLCNFEDKVYDIQKQLNSFRSEFPLMLEKNHVLFKSNSVLIQQFEKNVDTLQSIINEICTLLPTWDAYRWLHKQSHFDYKWKHNSFIAKLKNVYQTFTEFIKRVNELKTRRNELLSYQQNSAKLIQEMNAYLEEIQAKSTAISESCNHLKEFYREKSRDLAYILQEIESCHPIKDSIQKNLKAIDWYIDNQDKILQFLEEHDI